MSILDRFIGNLAPHDCVGCGYEGALLCSSCAEHVNKIPERCYRCRRNTSRFRVCPSCRKASSLRAVYVAAEYDGATKDLVWQLKFNGAQAAAATMARLMASLYPGDQMYIVPVPTATNRVRRRGYDQAELLAKQVAWCLELPYLNCLRRQGQTHQVGASRQERLQQLQDSFYMKNTPVDLPILLVDDVITTGATLEAATQALQRAGATNVSAMTFAQPTILGD